MILLTEWLNDADTTSELMSTVAKLCVRAEYCQEAFDCGALLVINDVLTSFPDRPVSDTQAREGQMQFLYQHL